MQLQGREIRRLRFGGSIDMIFMASTEVSVEKTVNEISEILSQASMVKYIQLEYDESSISGISFIVMAGKRKVPFRLFARTDQMLQAMKENQKTPQYLCYRDQAQRVEWRQLLRWVQAQMARVETGTADIKELFMPYLLSNNEEIQYQKEVNKAKTENRCIYLTLLIMILILINFFLAYELYKYHFAPLQTEIVFAGIDSRGQHVQIAHQYTGRIDTIWEREILRQAVEINDGLHGVGYIGKTEWQLLPDNDPPDVVIDRKKKRRK